MNEQMCFIPDCPAKVYAPAGTGALCKDHFVDFVKWRRRKGTQMFHKYGAMTIEMRDTVAAEWKKTVAVEQ